MPKLLKVRSIRSVQGKNAQVFSFFMPGSLVTEIADISRIDRKSASELKGFQRKEIKNHVRSIVDYLDQGEVLFPNAIILALGTGVEFTQSRGRSPDGTLDIGDIGTLAIPYRENGRTEAWIVDGQQRSLALSKTQNGNIPVPVVAFIAENLAVQREQFILVNKAKPLPNRLINELLPEVDTHLPRDLATRKIPSELCNLLNLDPESPFFGIIKRASSAEDTKPVVNDTAIMTMITKSLGNPLGALAQYKGLGNKESDLELMYRDLMTYWTAVKEVFMDAWGLPPNKSRLMHGAGIQAMGVLMDRIMARSVSSTDPAGKIKKELQRISARCCWTTGVWEDLGMEWDAIQNVPRHVKNLTDQLIRIDLMANRERLD